MNLMYIYILDFKNAKYITNIDLTEKVEHHKEVNIKRSFEDVNLL